MQQNEHSFGLQASWWASLMMLWYACEFGDSAQ